MTRFYYCLLVLSLLSCKTQSTSSYQVADINVTYTKISKKQTEQAATVLDFVQPYRDSMAKEMDLVIGINQENLNKRKPNCNLGNWMTDVLAQEAEMIFEREIDFAVQNYGGIRIPTLAKGEITKGDIFELMPFDNMLVLLELDSALTHQLCNRIADYGGWPISSGLSFTISDSLATEVRVNEKKLNGEQKYLVAIPDYISNGGDGCFFLKDTQIENSGVFIREVLINNVTRNNEEGNEIIADPKERIKS